MTIMTNPSKYQVFLKVIETKSITKAAELLGHTQSGVSHIIKSLEDSFGIQLITREKQNIELTPGGEYLMEPITRIVSWEQVLEEKLTSIHGISEGDLRIGTFCSVSVNWMPGIIKSIMSNTLTFDFI